MMMCIVHVVFINPLILPRNDTINVTEGSTLILHCSNPGNSGITRYQWFNNTGDELSDPVIVPPSLLPFNNIQRAFYRLVVHLMVVCLLSTVHLTLILLLVSHGYTMGLL
jgi:hypothetical protein